MVNPLCGGGGTAHGADTITTAVTWLAGGSPHLVTGAVVLAPGGTLTLDSAVFRQNGAAVWSGKRPASCGDAEREGKKRFSPLSA